MLISLDKVRASKAQKKEIEHLAQQLKTLKKSLVIEGYSTKESSLDASFISTILIEEFEDIAKSINSNQNNDEKIKKLLTDTIAKVAIRLYCSLPKEEIDELFLAISEQSKELHLVE